MVLAGIREMNSKGFWKPPGYGKSREFRGKSHSRQIGKFSGKCLQKSAKFWEIGKFLGFLGTIRNPADSREIGKFLGNVSKSAEIHFPGATFRDTGNDFPGEEVRDTGQKPTGHNPIPECLYELYPVLWSRPDSQPCLTRSRLANLARRDSNGSSTVDNF